MPDLELFHRAHHRWVWRLLAGNGAMIATGDGQGYENRADAARTADAVTSGLSADSASDTRLDRIREHLSRWKRSDHPQADCAALAATIRAILDPPMTLTSGNHAPAPD